MSKVAIKGADTGTGVFTLESPATNTDRTLVLPDEAGTVLTTATAGVPVNGPAFSAYLGTNQTISNATVTKVEFNTERFDVGSCFDTSTYRFTPTVAGYYQVNFSINLYGGSNTGAIGLAQLYKNGSVYSLAGTTTGAPGFYPETTGSALVHMNGSTDYLEVYAYFIYSSGTPTVGGDTSARSDFSAFLARSAT